MLLNKIVSTTALILTSLTFVSCSHLDQSSKKEKGPISFDVKKKVLDNGLTILAVENFKLPVFSYYTYFKVGSKYESPGTTGSSHLLEHMMFKGAKKYGEGEFDKLIEGNGGSNNAFTSNDLTVYFEDLPSEHFDVVVDLEADRMQNLLLAKESFEKERNVVLEERKMRYENSDRGKVYLQMMKTVFKGTPYGSSVIGEVEDLKTVTRDEVQKYFKTYYAPNNAVIVIVGAIDADEAIEKISKKFGSIPATKDLLKIKKDHLNKLGFKFSKKIPKTVNLKGTSPLAMFSLAYPGVKIGSRDGFVLDILSSIIGGGESSYLSKKFVTSRRPLLQNIYAANYTLQESGVFFIGGQLLKPTSLKKVRKSIEKEIGRSCDMAITERNVQKVLNQYLVDMLSGLDKNNGVARFLGDREVYYGSYDFYEKEIGIYSSVTVKELKDACEKFLKSSDSTFITIWNKN